MDKEPFIVVGMSVTGSGEVLAETMSSIINLDWTGCKVGQKIVKGALISANRDQIVNDALSSGATHILFVDSDIVFPADTVQKLLKHDVDICSAVYFTKTLSNCSPVAWKNINRDENGNVTEAIPIETIPNFGQVEGVGMGLCLIKAKVFTDIADKFRKGFAHEYNSGEDISFCIRARECGYKIHVDGTIPVGHIGTYLYSRNDYERLQKVRRKMNG